MRASLLTGCDGALDRNGAGGQPRAANASRTIAVDVLSKLRTPLAYADEGRLRRVALLAEELELKEGYASEHAGAVAAHALAIAEELGLGERACAAIEVGAALHDLGKLCVRDSVLSKAGPLTEPEQDVMRLHVPAGARLLASLIALPDVVAIVRWHHERWDGTGYPDGLSRDGIPLGARIVAVADAYRAMVEPRPYREAFSAPVARGRLQECAGTQFDPGCVDALLATLMEQEELVA